LEGRQTAELLARLRGVVLGRRLRNRGGRRRIREPKVLMEALDLGTLSVELLLEMQQHGTGGINRRGGGTPDARQRHQLRKPDAAKGRELQLPEAIDFGTLSRQLLPETKHQGIGRGADRRGREII